MTQTISGIHHVTAIAIDPQANIDFYTQVLGLRKRDRVVSIKRSANAVQHLSILPMPGSLSGRSFK